LQPLPQSSQPHLTGSHFHSLCNKIKLIHLRFFIHIPLWLSHTIFIFKTNNLASQPHPSPTRPRVAWHTPHRHTEPPESKSSKPVPPSFTPELESCPNSHQVWFFFCQSLFFFKKKNALWFCVFVAISLQKKLEFEHSVYFWLIFILCYFSYYFFKLCYLVIFSCCVMEKNTLGLKRKHDQPVGWFETIKSVLLLPQVAFYTRTWIMSQLNPGMIFFCQSLFLFFSFLFSFLVLLVCFCILFPCFRVLIFWIIFLIICYLVSCPKFLDNFLDNML